MSIYINWKKPKNTKKNPKRVCDWEQVNRIALLVIGLEQK